MWVYPESGTTGALLHPGTSYIRISPEFFKPREEAPIVFITLSTPQYGYLLLPSLLRRRVYNLSCCREQALQAGWIEPCRRQ
jgi:hypothetical protein